MNIGILTEDINLLSEFSKKFKVITCIEDVESFDVVVLISYSKIITKERLKDKIYLNVHNSLLPKYRGLHAFTWAIINGENTLGYTLHKVEPSIDSGAIISQIKFNVDINENINDIFKKGYEILINWIVKELETLSFEKIQNSKVQDEKLSIYVTKRRQEDNLIDWNQSSINIHNFVRALTPPYTEGAFTYHNSQKINIIKTKFLSLPDYIERVGKIVNKDNDGIWVKTKDNVILITEISIDSKIYKGGKEIQFKIGNLFSFSKE